MAWWNFGLWGRKRDSDYEAQALQSEWVAPTGTPELAPAPAPAAASASDDAAVFLDRVYSNQDC